MNEITLLLWSFFWAIIGAGFGVIQGRVGGGIILGAVLGPIGIFILMCLDSKKVSDAKNTKKCPHCAERIQRRAKICKHCGSSVEIITCPTCDEKFYKPEMPSGSPVECSACKNEFSLP
jgi:hypothetical protein